MSHFGKFIFQKKSFLPRHGIYFSSCQRKSFMSNTKTSSDHKTMNDIKRELGQRLETVHALQKDIKSKESYLKYMVKSQSELPTRKMKDSFDAAIVPLSSNKELRDRYITFPGYVRVGRLMEDIDLFAVWCCTKHLIHPNATEAEPIPYAIVTIRVDHIEMIQSLFQPNADIKVSGHVCWVGTSSLEVIIWLDQLNDGKWERIMTALLLMAARNRMTMGPSIVNKIEAQTPEEKLMLQGGEERKLKRLKMMNESLLKTVPSEEELYLIHDLFIKTTDSKDMFLNKKILPPKSKWMHDATLNSLVLCHPQYRNLHNKIFGGFLIRQALELSWSVGFIYGVGIPKLIHISNILFHSPVDVGSILKLCASVTYVEDEFIQVFVYAEVFGRGSGKGKSTTSFNFTYNMENPVDHLYPYTYLDAMKYIDGRRHFQEFKKLKESNWHKI